MLILTVLPTKRSRSRKSSRTQSRRLYDAKKRRADYLQKLREYRIMELPNPVTAASQARSKIRIEKHLAQFSKTKRARIEKKLQALRKSSRK
jgi:hypothetical protein